MSVKGTRFCPVCGQSQAEANAELLWDAYRRQGVEREEPLSFTACELEESGYGWEDEGFNPAVLAMERNMVARGLCGGCGLPDARRFRPQEEWLSEEDLREHYEMLAEMRAERLAGC